MSWKRLEWASYILAVLIVGAILIYINLFAARFYKKLDLTKHKIHSLSNQTIKILKSLDRNITIYGFYREGDESIGVLKELIDTYRMYSKRIELKIVDPDKNPVLAKKFNVTSYGTIVFACGNRTISISPFGDPREEDITNGIIRVTRESKKKIYFLEGHGERDIEDTSPGGYYQAKRELEKKGFSVESLNLLSKGRVPKDAAVVVVAGPKKPLLRKEWEMLYRFWKKGGGVLVMIDPQYPSPGFVKDKWFIVFDNDIVVDPLSKLFGGNPLVPIVTDFPESPITENFNLAVFFPIVRSLRPSGNKTQGFDFTCIARTNKSSWGEVDIKKEQWKFDEGKDKKGPLCVGYIVKSGEVKGRTVFYGDSDFPSNSFLNMSGNKDLFLNSISYLAEEKDLISISPREEENTPLYLTSTQSRVLFLVSVVFIPLIFGLLGLTVWLRRRKL